MKSVSDPLQRCARGASILTSWGDRASKIRNLPADPELVPKAVMTAVGLRDESGRWPISRLIEHVDSRPMVLVLDNCEHLLDACAVLADALLREAGELRVLATSRQPRVALFVGASWRRTQENGVFGRSWSTLSTVMSTRSLKKLTSPAMALTSGFGRS